MLSFTSDFVIYPTSINVFSYYSILCFTYVIVFCASNFVLSPTSMNVCFASNSIFYPTFVCISYPYDY